MMMRGYRMDLAGDMGCNPTRGGRGGRMRIVSPGTGHGYSMPARTAATGTVAKRVAKSDTA